MAREAFRGLPDLDRHLAAGACSWSLAPGEECMIVASMDASAELDSKTALNIRQDYELHLVGKAGAREETRARLCLAADQFIVRRPLADDPDGRTVIAGYHWFSDWGRDTMIALPGLTLSTGRPELAKKILSTFARFIDGGMLPNQFPEAGHAPEYNTVDAALWYFEAVRAYIEKTGDLPFLAEIFPILEEMVRFHVTGTRYNIHVDPSDGLLYAGTAGKQITWMDVKIGDWVVTPRIGKPVEINALWFNALKTMAHFCELLGRKEPRYDEMALRAKAGFERFWNAGQGFCFDVLDTPSGDDASLRPNQLFAVSLRHSPLTTARQKAVVDICAEQLLTPFGLRSLGPSEKAYAGRYGGDQVARDRVYHQGTVWGWLIGSFVQAHLKVYNDKSAARAFLEGLAGQTATHGLGTLSEIFEGDPPHAPRGAIAQAWTVAEWLRTMDLLD